MTQTISAVDADRALKSKHRAMWALGNYAAVATEVVGGLGPVLVAASGLRPGDRVLDVAAGSGNAAIGAALAGADVTASDLTPELLDVGRRSAADVGAQLKWDEGDVEALPYDDESFDVVLSCVGVMFAPHHQASADELLRVCRPGGTIALINWTPKGFIGQMFAAMKPYAPPPPPGAQPPPLWGDDEHVRGLFGDRVSDVTARRQFLEVATFDRPEDFRDYFKTTYGPTISTYRAVGDDADQVTALDVELAELARRHDRGTGDSLVMDWEYLLLTARKRDPGQA
jgi:ubiquinone/menaquinone biosynthesis C-methylase UbiE